MKLCFDDTWRGTDDGWRSGVCIGGGRTMDGRSGCVCGYGGDGVELRGQNLNLYVSMYWHPTACETLESSRNFQKGIFPPQLLPKRMLQNFSAVDGRETSETSMHSSRMRTARLFPVSPSINCAVNCSGVSVRGVSVWGCLFGGGGVCSWGRGCLLPGEGVSATPPCEQNDWQTDVKT